MSECAINLCITASYNILDPSYGGGVRVLNLLKQLNESAEINKIIVVVPYIQHLDLEKITLFSYPSHRDFKLFKSLNKINIIDEINPFKPIQLIRLIKKYKINILQNENIWGGLSSIIASSYCHVPLIIDEHNFEAGYAIELKHNKLLQIYIKILESMAAKYSRHIITVSMEDKEKISFVYNIPLNKISVIPNGVNFKITAINKLEKSNLRSKLHLNNKFVIVFHGSLDYGPNKDVVILINDFIIPKIINKIPNVLFLVIGRNPPKIFKQSPFIKLTGFVSNLNEYLISSDLAVVPLLRGGGTKLKILDYVAASLPIVATKKAFEGLPLINNESVLLSNNVDEKFINNILKVYNNYIFYYKLANRSNEVKNIYDWSNVVKKLINIYLKI